MISAEMIIVTLAGGGTIVYTHQPVRIEKPKNNLRKRNNSSVKYTHIICARSLYRKTRTGEPLTYAPGNNFYRATLSLFYFFLNVQSIV